MTFRVVIITTRALRHGSMRRIETFVADSARASAFVVLVAQARVGKLAPQRGVITGAVRSGPSHRGSILRARLANRRAAKEMHERAKVLGALVHLIRRDVRELRELAARFLARLAAHRVLG